MPNPHYQRVLEQDQALPAPLRWLSRAMSSWWAMLGLGIFVVGYVAVAHVPLGDKYLWQWRIFDTTQHAVLTWWPLLVAAWLLAAVVLWSAMRRLPWRIDNFGAFVAVLGLATILISQSWAFRSQSVGIAAVPISEATGSVQADALSLNYTTRYGDTHDRVLVVMVGGAAPITIPLDNILRWNDATGSDMPRIKLHDHPKLASIIGYGTRITTSAYIAFGDLSKNQDATQSATPWPKSDRNYTTLPYPAYALLALEITNDLKDGGTQTTTVWLPFEPEGTDALIPKQFFPVGGLGSVGLAFRPASKKVPFALGATDSAPKDLCTLYVADADNDGRLTQPVSYDFPYIRLSPVQHVAQDRKGKPRTYRIDYLVGTAQGHVLMAIKTSASNPFILAGLITFILGVALDRLLDWLGGRSSKPKAASNGNTADKSPIPDAAP